MTTPTTFTKYRRSQIAELRPYAEGETLDRVSISAADSEAGSPKPGDMIARNPKNHADQWLVAAKYFADNFEPMTTPTTEAAARFEEAAKRFIYPSWSEADYRELHSLASAALTEQATEIERLKADNAALVSAFDDLRRASHGVTGLHLNGDVAPWSELSKGGRFEEWCIVFDEPHPSSEILKALAYARAAGVREVVEWLTNKSEHQIPPDLMRGHTRSERRNSRGRIAIILGIKAREHFNLDGKGGA